MLAGAHAPPTPLSLCTARVHLQSTYCATIAKHCETIKRSVHVVNLDPAVETCDYPLAADIRDLISLEEVMEAKGHVRSKMRSV